MARKNTPKVYKRVQGEEYRVRMIARNLLHEAGLTFPEDWDIFVVDQKRGVCHYGKQYITIPFWVITQASFLEGSRGKDIYYIAHELAHIFSYGANHGQRFMEAFMQICPVEYQHYEYGYKPRHARAAGVAQKGMK